MPASVGARGFLVAIVLAACAPGSPDPRPEPPPDAVTLTWLSVTNWLVEAGDVRILFDGYVGRVDRTTVSEDGSSTAPARPDSATVRWVRDAAFPDGSLDLVLVGHGHWDHALDAPAWARLTGARIVGSRTVCLQAAAHGVTDCAAVEGGEVLEVGPHVRVRTVRWHHSGDSTSASGRALRAPLELRDMPTTDPATGGLLPGFLDDYPNGGGSRAWIVTVNTDDGPVTLFWSNTGNPQAWDAPVRADSIWFREQGIDVGRFVWAASDRPTRDELQEALRAEGLDGVDAWIGFGGTAHVRQVAPLLRPRAFLPHHWDDFWVPLTEGTGRPFNAEPLQPVLDPAGVRLVVPSAVFDRFRLTTSGIVPLGNAEPLQRFQARRAR